MSEHDPILDSPLFEIFADSATSTYFYMLDIASGISRWSSSAVQEFSMPGEYMADALGAWLPHIHPEDRPGYEKNLSDMFAGKTGDIHCCEYRARNHAGTYLWVRCKGYLRRDSAGKPWLFAGVMNNLGPLSKYDSVTGLYTLHELSRRLSIPTQTPAGGLLLLGIDNFHLINDTYGYQAGNRILHDLSVAFQKQLPQGTFYRMDGDKFAYTQPGAGHDELAEAFALCRQCGDSLTRGDVSCPVSLTGGGLLVPQDGTDFESVYSNADMALNAAKRTQPGQLLFYSAGLHETEQRRSALLAALHQDVLAGCRNFELFYQPLITVGGSAAAPSAEALLRWHHPGYPDIGPAEFIPLLESNGDIVAVGTWVLEQGLAQCRAWMGSNAFHGISINVSYQQIVQKDFCETVCRLFHESGLPEGSVCLELTESCRVADLGFLQQTLAELRRCGLCTALDDFGTGYANFSVLRSLTPDWVKIDYTLSREAVTNRTDRAILTSLLNLSGQLGIHACVEGVETRELELLATDSGANLLQGYLYGKPMPAHEFARNFLPGNPTHLFS